MKINMQDMNKVQVMNHIELGAYGEVKAQEYLIKQGYEILERNLRTPLGEIDIVACKNGVLVVVEVKTRRTKSYGLPCEAVSKQKQGHIKGALQWYLQRGKSSFETIRFDVMEVYIEQDIMHIRHLKGCFC